MMGDYHVRFCERLRGETPLCLLGKPQALEENFAVHTVCRINEIA